MPTDIPTPTGRIPVAVYLRPSPGAERHAGAWQRAALDAFAAAQFMEIVAAYEELPDAGETPEARPALRALLDAAASPARVFEFVLVTEAERLDIGASETGGDHDAALRHAGAPPLYVTEPFRNDGRAVERRLRRAWRAEANRNQGVAIAAGKARGAVSGFCQGGVTAYGLRRLEISRRGRERVLEPGEWKGGRRVRSLLVPGPSDEVDTVRRIFALYALQGLTGDQIARRLNAEGAPTGASPRPWSRERVMFILGNQVYVGVRMHRRTGKGAADVLRVPEACEPVVGRGLFEAARARRAGRTRVFTDAEILDGLRRTLKRHGVLTRELIERDPELPTVETVAARLGSLGEAYTRIGYQPPGDWDLRRAMAVVRAGGCYDG